MTKVLRARNKDGRLNEDAIDEAAQLLRNGRLVALPTETVYGLGACALDPAAVRRIFQAKERPSFNPLIVHVPNVAKARELSSAWPEAAQTLAVALWPGPLTLVVPKVAIIPAEVTGGLDSVALRAPAHPAMQAVLERAGVPIAAPSANRFGGVSPTTAQHVLHSLGGRIDAVLDDGPTQVGIESTVLDLCAPIPRLLRPGGMSPARIEALIGPVQRMDVVLDEGARSSPGLLSRHYAPDAETTLVREETFAKALAGLPAKARVGAVVRTRLPPEDPRIVAWERLGEAPDIFARDLYAALHRIEQAGATHVLLEEPPPGAAWEALSDRLRRAAGARD